MTSSFQLFIRPLRRASPPIIRPSEIDEFIEEVFGNILDLRECNRRLLEVMYVRQREQAPVIHGIGDIFLDAATEFRLAYPSYVGHLPVAEKRVKDETERNAEFRRFVEVCVFLCVCVCKETATKFLYFEAMCSQPRGPPSRSQTLPESSIRASAEVPRASGGYLR